MSVIVSVIVNPLNNNDYDGMTDFFKENIIVGIYIFHRRGAKERRF